MAITAKTVLAVLGTATVAAFTAAPASADPVPIGSGHWDIVVEYDCDDAEVLGVHAHNHDTEQEVELEDAVFEVGSSTTTAAPWASAFSNAPVRFIDPNSSGQNEFILGLEVEYVDEGTCGDSVDIARTGTPALSTTGSRAAGFRAADAPDTVFDSATGSGLNGGLTLSGHEDLWWGFTHAGTYTLELTATPTLGGAPAGGEITFSVS